MFTYMGTVTDMDWAVTVNGEPLNPKNELVNHSPDGFSWGYAGSGPAQLAFAMLYHHFYNIKRDLPIRLLAGMSAETYQQFKFRYIAKLNQKEGFEINSQQIDKILHEIVDDNESYPLTKWMLTHVSETQRPEEYLIYLALRCIMGDEDNGVFMNMTTALYYNYEDLVAKYTKYHDDEASNP